MKQVKQILPSLYINYNIPSDEPAKRVKRSYLVNAYMPEVPILSFKHAATPFLQSIAEAINSHFVSSKLIDLTKVATKELLDQLIKTDHLKLIITVDSMLFSHQELMKYYQEFPAKKRKSILKNTPSAPS